MAACLALAVLMVAAAAAGPARAGDPMGAVTGVRYQSYADRTRVVLDLSAEADCTGNRLANPDRVYVDLKGCHVPDELKAAFEGIEVGDGRLGAIRAAEYQPGVVRVVLDLASGKEYKVFTLRNPARVVIDLYDGAVGGREGGARDVASLKGWSIAPPPSPSVKRIVIDPGHGGKDPGAIGPGGVQEKDIVLKVAGDLKKELDAMGGFDVVLTRTADVYLELDERVEFANRHGADLFLSIHVNASPDRSVRGIETYLLNWTNDEAAIKVAARENKIFLKHRQKARNDVEAILASLGLQNKRDESLMLAHLVQDSMVGAIGTRYRGVHDLGVKQALFYVLLGARMPSVLVETSFITNTDEAARLKSQAYRHTLAQGIARGVKAYFENAAPVEQIARR
jgi:N-acetylmuramoyl-L-alanine amidase